VIGIVWVQAALAAQVALRLDTEQIREGQTVRLDLQVVDASAKAIPKLEVPEGLSVAFKGQGRQAMVLDFRATSTTTFSYELTALQPGTYTVGPYSVTTSEGDLLTQAVQLTVAPRSASDTDSFTGNLGTDVAWVGQVLIYRLRFETDKTLIRGGSRWTPPSPQGFTSEPTVEGVTAESRLEQDGKAISVLELDFPLRASSPGKWTVNGGVLQTQYLVTDKNPRRRNRALEGMGMFGEARDEVYSTPPLPVEVRPLPTEGRPADASGLVGHFSVASTASSQATKVGDTVTVEVVVEGDGPLAGFALPPLAGDGFRVYDDQPVVVAAIEDGKYHAKATFKRAIVPLEPGDLAVPAVDLAFFDPSAGAWARATTEPIRLEVTGDAAQANPTVFSPDGPPKGVSALGEDILPVRTESVPAKPLPRALALAWLAPGGLALVAQAILAFGRRTPRAGRARREDFSDLPMDAEGRLAGIERIFRERVAGRLGIAPEALRREDLAALGPAAEEAEAIYRALERRRYGGHDAVVSEERVRALVEGW
jgi:hypothetical protein